MKLKTATFEETLRYGRGVRMRKLPPMAGGAGGALLLHAAGTSTSTVSSIAAVDTTGASLLVLHVVANTPTPVVADSESNTWAALTSRTSSGVISQIYYAENPTVGPGHTFSCTGNFSSIELLAFTGMVTSGSFDRQNGAATAGGLTISPGSITPTADGDLVVSGVMGINALNPTVDSSMILTDGVPYVAGKNYGGAVAYIFQGSAAPIAPTWTVTGSDHVYAATIASFFATGQVTKVADTPKRMPMAV